MAREPYAYLKLLFSNNLLLNLDEYDLSHVQTHGLVCRFLGMRLSSTFQPIFKADGTVLGREALLRSVVHEQFELIPQAAFDEAERAGRLVQFDRLVRTIHLLNHDRSFPEHELLFLNVHPHLLTSVSDHGRTFEQILHYYSVPTSQVVIEIKESAVKDMARLDEAVSNYRKLGYKIAVDDFGLAHASVARLAGASHAYEDLVADTSNDELARVLKLRPDIVKFDGGVLRNPLATGVIYALVNTLHQSGVQVAIEGIESATQLAIAHNAGADLFQGDYLASPEFATQADVRYLRAERLAA
ncbi:EAL domain-containing protein [Ferriphaselus sp. R-1]|uniref:EAL domain-containing protein n=1 Tax=Ferriphaselus sp. R-1 TaxID=1485544 RepID=UPI000551752B|nr:EAL domain-containing protein [Ferriphaselus sp. R-1]